MVPFYLAGGDDGTTESFRRYGDGKFKIAIHRNEPWDDFMERIKTDARHLRAKLKAAISMGEVLEVDALKGSALFCLLKDANSALFTNCGGGWITDKELDLASLARVKRGIAHFSLSVDSTEVTRERFFGSRTVGAAPEQDCSLAIFVEGKCDDC